MRLLSASAVALVLAIGAPVPMALGSNPPDSARLAAGHGNHEPAGTLDQSFGTAGKVVTDFSGTGSVDTPAAVAIQRNGKIVVVGASRTTVYGQPLKFALARYDAQGSLDATFGNGGLVLTAFGGNASGDNANAVTIQADGKIIVGGYSDRGNGTGDFALARYNSDGSLDVSFGVAGMVVTDLTGSSDDGITSLALDRHGRIVVGGFSMRSGNIPSPTPPEPDFALARYSPNGSLDPSFGTGGHVITNMVDQGTAGAVEGIAIQHDGRIVATGIAGLFGSYDFALARYEDDGSLDATFGIGGKVLTDFGGSWDEATAVELEANGRILVAGASNAGGSFGFALARYDRDGSLDQGFGTDGKVRTDFSGGFAAAEGVEIQHDGKIVAVGLSPFAVARYERDGNLDQTFGTGGMVTAVIGGSDGARAVALQQDGKIVVAGETAASLYDYDFALIRLLP